MPVMASQIHLGSEQHDFEIQLSLNIRQLHSPTTKAFLPALFSALTKAEPGLEGSGTVSVKNSQQVTRDLGSNGQYNHRHYV